VVRELAYPLIRSGRLGLLPAAFNPPTFAHLALAQAAAEQHALAQVVLVLPADLPHKDFDQVGFALRRELLVAAVQGAPGVTAAVCGGGLFHQIADEFQAFCGPVEPALIAGRDAAERIVSWNYGTGPAIADQLARFEMLVAARRGAYSAPPELAGRIRRVAVDPRWDAVSSSGVREAIASGDDRWDEFVPELVARRIREERLYGLDR